MWKVILWIYIKKIYTVNLKRLKLNKNPKIDSHGPIKVV